jgi:predicted acyl esterase
MGLSAVSSPAAATVTCPLSMMASSPVTPPGGQPFVVCTGRIRSFDGTPLDTDVTIPIHHGVSVPLVGFLHGWGGSKTDWESTTLAGNGADQYDWNNAWFAAKGWISLNYTARGFHFSCGKDTSGYSYQNDSTCSDTKGEKSWTHLADRRWEIRDFQYLAGLLVDAKIGINPDRIVATGGSYGGGQSWELALSQNRVISSACTDTTTTKCASTPWTSAKHTPLKLAAALPMYQWTDLVDALQPNGTASDGLHGAPPTDGNHLSPYGVEKQSYVNGLYALGLESAQYAAPNADPSADLSAWFAEINAGEPYSSNPNAATVAAQIGGGFRSPHTIPIPAGSGQIPVFVVQGLTDPLFDGLQAIDMINHLHISDPNYPVWAFLGDVGHSYADNPHDVWEEAHAASNAWLSAVVTHGALSSFARVSETTTRCVTGQTLTSYQDASFDQLADSTMIFKDGRAQSTANNSGATNEGAVTDPIANSGCRSMAASQSDPNQAVYTFTPTSSATLLGGPVVHVTAALTGSNAEVAAHLWDLDPSGNQTLMTRTVFRIDEGSNPTSTLPLAFELWPNAWQLACGHQVKLELTQNDSPTWRVDNEPSSISFTGLQLSLPVRLGTTC